MKQEEIRFKIDQLRKDKTIYAVEACAITLASMVAFFSASIFLPPPFNEQVGNLAIVISLGYTTFMIIGNLKRFKEIRKLEKMLAW